MTTILMTEEYWANSPFSIARYCGCIKISGIEYIIVNKEGKDLFECSIKADKQGREKAIEPGEPADLIRADFKQFYRKLGRDKFIAVLEENSNAGIDEMKRIMKGTKK